MIEQFFLTTAKGSCPDIFLAVLNMSITASYLVLAVIIARFILRKAPKRILCFLWLLVGLRLVVPFSIESAFSMIPDGTIVTTDMMYESKPAIHASKDMTSIPTNPSMQSLVTPVEEESINHMQIITMICSIVWFIGMIVMLFYFIISWSLLRHKVKMAIPKLWNGTKIYQSDAIETPFLLGILCPRIYMPMYISEADLPYVVMHEMAHKKRKDYLIKPIGFLILTVYWFNPVIWLAYILLCRDIELACDEMVIKDFNIDSRKEYSKALLSCSVNRRTIAACPVAFGEVGVKERVKNVLSYKKPTFWVIIAMAIACIIIPVCFMTQKKEYVDSDNEVFTKQPDLDAEDFDILKETLTEQLLVKGVTVTTGDLTAKKELLEESNAVLMEEYEVLQRERMNAKPEEIAQIDTAISQKEAAINKIEAELDIIEELLSSVTQNSNITKGEDLILPFSIIAAETITKWAEAFINRDAEAIIEMSDKTTQTSLEQSGLLSKGTQPTFGYSSPWPWGSEDDFQNYQIVEMAKNTATILYYAWTSEPHVTVWVENLSFQEENDNCRITSEKLYTMNSICIAEEFYRAYPNGVINNTMMDYLSYNGAGEALNQNAKRNKEHWAYKPLFEPDTAAVFLLNMLDNRNKVEPVVTGEKESGRVQVTFQFHEDGSNASITMIQPYGEDGIWLPQTASDSSYDSLLRDTNEEHYDIGIQYRKPVEDGHISDPYGVRTHPATGEQLRHNGIDFSAPKGTAIMAAASGIVYECGFDKVYGNYVIMQHENGEMSYYTCCDEILVQTQQRVEAGEQIATVGNTGQSTGAHLHFAISRDGRYIEPVFEE